MTINKQVRLAIELAAKNATQGEWRYGRSGFNSIVQAPVVLPRGGSSNVVICKLFRSEWRGELKTAQDAAFIAAANPATVLALLADLDAAQQRIAELEVALTCENCGTVCTRPDGSHYCHPENRERK